MTPQLRQAAQELLESVQEYIDSGCCTEAGLGGLVSSSRSLREAMAALDGKQSTPEPDWLSIYQAYPRKEGKPSAKRAIVKALKTTPYDRLLERTKAYKVHCDLAGTAKCFTPLPATWFNDERYNDDWGNPLDANPQAKSARITELSHRIKQSPAFPGGPRWTELATKEDRIAYEDAVSELTRISPGFNFNTLRR